MLWIFWVVAALVVVFISRNVRYALYMYWANRQRAVFTIYMIFLLLFGSLVMTLTTKVLDFTQQAKQLDVLGN